MEKRGAAGDSTLQGGSHSDRTQEGLIPLSFPPQTGRREGWDCAGASPCICVGPNASNQDIREREEGRAGRIQGMGHQDQKVTKRR